MRNARSHTCNVNLCSWLEYNYLLYCVYVCMYCMYAIYMHAYIQEQAAHRLMFQLNLSFLGDGASAALCFLGLFLCGVVVSLNNAKHV